MSKPGKVLPWSYSSLSAFETCPRRYHLTRITREVSEPQTEATLWGNQVHQALEYAVKGTKALEPAFTAYQPIVDRIRAADGRKFTEQKFGLTNSFTPTAFFGKDVWFRGVIDLQVVREKTALAFDYKGLALDTPLPTPTGWTTMGEVRVGDVLFGSDGQPCTVTGKSAVQRKPCYRLTFDDTSTVIADEDHLWLIDGRVQSTKEIAEANAREWGNGRRKVVGRAPLPRPLACDTATLPIHPYLLGVWLGDGKHTSGEVCKPDEDLWANIRACGYTHGDDISGRGDRARASTVYGLRTQLREQGLLGNKHIPAAYLRASWEQRLALLQGLMDTDGSVNTARKQLIFSTCDRALAGQVFELLVSLGQRPLINDVIGLGFDQLVRSYPISFRPLDGVQAFRLPRKAEQVGEWGAGRSNVRRVKTVESVETVPTQCITVDSPDSTYLCTKHMLVTHNTGKVRTDGDQLKLFAAATFAQHPHIEKVHTQYLWLAHDKTTGETFHRDDLPSIWQEFVPRINRMTAAQDSDRWMPSPSGLCNGWCPVGPDRCEFWKPKREARSE